LENIRGKTGNYNVLDSFQTVREAHCEFHYFDRTGERKMRKSHAIRTEQ
jgi:hypothetical protein